METSIIKKSSNFSNISIIVPCFNEEAGIAKSIQDLKNHMPLAEIIIINDSSTDNTAKEIKKFKKVIVVNHEFNKGYGSSLKTGMRIASKKYIAWFDADNEHRASDLVKMYYSICNSSSLAVIGERSNSTSGLRYFGKLMIRGLARLMGTSLGKDINCGLRIMERAAIIPFLSVLPNGFSASLTTTMILIHKKQPFNFHPISTNKRIGTSKVELIHGFETLIFVLRLSMLFEPIKVFVTPGLWISFFGLTYGIYQGVTAGLGVPVFAAVMFMFGSYLIALGIIADQISQLRLQEIHNHE